VTAPGIRAFRWSDIPAAVAIESESFAHNKWSAESFWGELAGVPLRARYFALVGDGDLVGYAGVAFIDGDAHLQTIAVTPPARGRGYGRMLVNAVLQQATARGAGRCLLEVQANNVTAIQIYEWAGFEQLSVRPRYYAGGHDALVLCRALSAPTAVTN
jgi:ribosomal-protein-alanine N-acetyltransferase